MRSRRTQDEILWLSDIHPEASEIVRVQLSVGSDLGEDLLFDGSRSELHVSC